MTSLYKTLVAAGCQIDSHESDLYARVTPESEAIVKVSARPFSHFLSKLDGKMWMDVPFAFEPWWEAKAKLTAGKRK